jgi:hypothetical protein
MELPQEPMLLNSNQRRFNCCAVCCLCLQVCSALGQIAKHSVDLAEVVVEAEVFPKCLTCLKYPDEFVRKHAATLVREVVKHTPELAQLVVANGGVGALVEYCNESNGNNRWVLRRFGRWAESRLYTSTLGGVLLQGI